MSRSSRLLVAVLLIPLLPGAGAGQLLFDWPIRALPQPEAVLTGAAATFWNPGSLSRSVGTRQEFWIAHVDGPDATGIRGLAAAGALDLPLGLRGAVGYWHLGIPDIPRTTDSPRPEPGDLQVTEDVGVVALARDLLAPAGLGGSLYFVRGEAAGVVRTRILGDVGFHLHPVLPLRPRFGLSLRGLGGDPTLLGGMEITLPSLVDSRVPLRLGYGMETRRDSRSPVQRLSARASWEDVFHVGIATTRFGAQDGWVPLWMVGTNIGRYSFSVLRESLANGFGAVHYFRLAVGF